MFLCIDKPSIELQQTFIHTKETDETEIVCVVHASPRATVEWLKDGQKMGDGENKWVSLEKCKTLNQIHFELFKFIRISYLVIN